MALTNQKRSTKVTDLEIEVISRIQRKRVETVSTAIIAYNWFQLTQKSKDFDVNHKLSGKYQIKSAGNHFYQIGLTFYRFADEERTEFHNPYAILILTLVIILRSIISMVIPEDNETLHIIIGDFCHVLGIKYHLNPALIILFGIDVLCLLLNINHFIGEKKPVYLKPFSIISGLSSPQSLGLTDEKDIKKMVTYFKIGSIILKYFMVYIMLINALLNFIPLMATYKWYQLILFGFPWSITYSVTLYFSLKIFTYQILYFYIICFYLKSKLKVSNNKIKFQTKFKSRRFTEILSLIKSLDMIYKEITEQNKKYWSNLNLVMISSCGLVINMLFFVSIYSSIHIMLKVMFFYMSIMFSIISILFLRFSALVAKQSFMSHKLLNDLYLSYNKWGLPFSLSLKVYSFQWIYEINKIIFQISSFIERIGSQSIGFYCGNFFLIDNNAISQV